jgi:hypothetical protein
MIDGVSLAIKGKLIKAVQLQDEFCVSLEDPAAFIGQVRDSKIKADVFTFVQGLHEKTPRHSYYQEWESMAVLPITTYDHWINKTLTFKPRNKVRKAQKSGVETRVIEFSDELVRGIMELYNETTIRQGKRNWNYGKDFETVKREHATFNERSEFIGAYFENKLIGFAKVIHSKHYSILINIVASIPHRDKAPTNALLAKTIELTANKNIPLLNFGIWGRRGLNDLKVANGFKRFEIPRYYVPLNLKGQLALKWKLHHGLKQRMPEKLIVFAADLRGKWNAYRHRDERAKPTTAGAAQ